MMPAVVGAPSPPRRPGPGAVVALAALALGLGLTACGGAGGRGERHPGAPIVLVSIDTLRADRLPAYGYRGVATPAIDRLAAEGIVFERAYASVPLTLPSHATMFTGLLPPRHGVRDNTGYAFDPAKTPTLARALRGAGYATGGAISAFVLRAETRIGDGFDRWEAALRLERGETLDSVQRPGEATLEAILPWLRERKAGQPFFLFLHLYEPHAPYAPPPPWNETVADPYDGEVAAADAIVGRLFDELARLGHFDRSIVALVSDHGEGLGDHGENQHGIFLYRGSIEVPWILKLPGGARRGERRAAPVHLADLKPTLLDLAGVAVPEGLDGLALLGRSAPAAADLERRPLYAETFYPRIHFGWSDLASIVRGRHHYIEAPRPEMYDLLADPAERVDISSQERRVFAELKAALAPHDRSYAAPAETDEETARQLAALGYLGTGVTGSGPLPDPKDQRGLIVELEAAVAASQLGEYQRAIESFERALAQYDRMPDIWAYYAQALEQLGRIDEAAKAYERSLEVAGGTPSLALGVASKLVALGRPDRAVEVARLAERQDPARFQDILIAAAKARGDTAGAERSMRQAIAAGTASPALRRELAEIELERGRLAEALAALPGPSEDAPVETVRGTVLFELGQLDEARAALERALELDPELARAHEMLGVVTLRQGRPAEALAVLERAVALNRRLARAWNALGVARYQTGDRPGALAAWAEATAGDPRLHEAWYNLALVSLEQGDRAGAVRSLRRYLETAPSSATQDRAKARQLLAQLGS